MIGVIVPAHNEEEALGGCLESLCVAARDPHLEREDVCIVVVLDACDDGSECIARAFNVDILRIRSRNVGRARAIGATHCLRLGARWLAFTDADTCVSPAWISRQLALKADAVCGSVGVAWKPGDGVLRERFERHYTDAEGHRHIHGANLGLSAEAYAKSGGFASLPSHEDVALVKSLREAGIRIAWSARPRVLTSARLVARAMEGFGATLARLAGEDGVARVDLQGK